MGVGEGVVVSEMVAVSKAREEVAQSMSEALSVSMARRSCSYVRGRRRLWGCRGVDRLELILGGLCSGNLGGRLSSCQGNLGVGRARLDARGSYTRGRGCRDSRSQIRR